MLSHIKPGRILQALELSENNMLLLLAVAVGLATGFGVWLFRELIEIFHELFVVQLADSVIGELLAAAHIDPRFSIVIVLAFAGAIVGGIVTTFIGHEKHHGVAGVIESVALTGGRLPVRKLPFKTLASVISLGAGASVGPEDPSVQIGSNIGSFFGQLLKLSEERVRLLVSAGAASAIAAAFNAPIAGVFFALEVILGEFTTGSFSTVVLSAVIASAFMQAVGGEHQAFGILSFELGDPMQLPFYVLLGLILAIVSSLAIRLFHWQSDFWHNAIRLPLPLETAITGAMIGLVGLVFPQILGSGESFMHEVLTGHSDLAVTMLVAIGLVKLLMTAISVGGGFVGGVFAPTLFIGIMLGSGYGQLVNRILGSELVGTPQAYAIAGMAGLLAGIVRAPITAVLLVFELTNDYQLILPIMLTSVVCVMVVERIGPAGIYLLSLIKQGIHIQQGRDVDVMQGVLVREAMVSPAPSIPHDASLAHLREELRRLHTRALCVLGEGNTLVGIVTLGDLQRIYERAAQEPTLHIDQMTVYDICTTDVITSSPDEVLWTAIRHMGARDIGRLPVVKPGTRHVVGMVRRHDIMNAYNIAISRKLTEQHTAAQIRLNTLTGAHVTEYHITTRSPIVHTKIQDIHWPPDAVVASIKRKGKLIVPHGSTVLEAGDLMTIVANPESEDELGELFGS